MSMFKCPYGHWLDTAVVGEEGTFECAECNRAYMERKVKPEVNILPQGGFKDEVQP